jgi:hypothetical protein
MTSLLHTLGTVSVENGSTTVTGDGTGWVVGAVKGGVFSCRGLAIPIDDVPGDEELLLAYPWPGPDIDDEEYAISLVTARAAETTWVAGRLAEIIVQLSLSGIVPDGAGSLAERDALDPIPGNGFMYLRAEVGFDLELYRKVPSGWDGPFPLRGLSIEGSGRYLAFAPASNANELYRIDTTSGGLPRSATVASVAGDTITLTAANAGLFFVPGMTNHSLVRIWNISKDPWQSAWVKARPTTSSLQVHASGDIAGWANGETIQIGDTGSPLAPPLAGIVTVDVSPAMMAAYGKVFRQRGMVIAANIVSGGTAGDGINFSPTGAGGSAVALTKVMVAGVQSGNATAVVACTELSPVSNSNLVKLQENFVTTGGVRLVRCSGFFL